MKLIYNIPRDWTIALTAGSWLTDTDALLDPNPGERARLKWPAGTQTTSTNVGIQLSRAQSFVPIGGCMRGLRGMPEGAKIEVTGKRAADSGFTYDLGGNSMTQRTVALPGGDVGITWAFATGLDAVVAVQVLIYNDVGGSVSWAAEASLDMGLIAIGGGLSACVKPEASISQVDPSKSQRTLGSQVSRVRRIGYRELGVTPTLSSDTGASGLTLTADWQAALVALRSDPFCLCVARDKTAADIQDGVYGMASKIPEQTHAARRYYNYGQLAISEIPGGE